MHWPPIEAGSRARAALLNSHFHALRRPKGGLRCTEFSMTICAAAALLTASSPVGAHHPSGLPGSGSSGRIVTIPGTTLTQGAINAWAACEYISFDELSDAVLAAAAANDEDVHSLASLESPMAGLSYGITDRLTVSLQLPYVIRTGIREGAHGHDEHGHAEHGHAAEGEHEETEMSGVVDLGDSDGIGDLSILGQYRVLGKNAGPQASLLLGIKTPTGKTDERNNEGELFETEFQPGSGSWDGLFGMAVTKAWGDGRWIATCSMPWPPEARSRPISAIASTTMVRSPIGWLAQATLLRPPAATSTEGTLTRIKRTTRADSLSTWRSRSTASGRRRRTFPEKPTPTPEVTSSIFLPGYGSPPMTGRASSRLGCRSSTI